MRHWVIYCRAITLIVSLVSVVSCNFNKPLKDADYHFFNPLKGWKDNDSVVLFVEFPKNDNEKGNDLYLNFSIKDGNRYSTADSVVLFLNFISPHSKKYSDTLAIPLSLKGRKFKKILANKVVEYNIPYAQNIIGNDGEWTISVKKSCDYPLCEDIVGIGVYIKR